MKLGTFSSGFQRSCQADRGLAVFDVPHLHRCCFNRLGGYGEQCPGMFECEDDCSEDDQETIGFCPEHAKLADELEAIVDGRI